MNTFNKNMHIAIDGPSGSGKSTIAKLVAQALNYIYIDTGAMYRAIAFNCINLNINLEDESDVISSLKSATINVDYINGEQYIYLNNKDISNDIRGTQIAQVTSKIATIREVRKKLVQMQQNLAQGKDIVMDGRDIGTIVLPYANLKIFLTASVEARATRRQKELMEKGEIVSVDCVIREFKERDERDINRQVNPLKQADDAILIDTTYMNIEEVVTQIVSEVKR